MARFEPRRSRRIIIQNILKSWSLHSVYRLLYNRDNITHTQAKVVIFRNRVIALLASVVHLAPIATTAIMARLVFYDYWIGGDLTPFNSWDKQANLTIQFAAKFLESLIIGSLATIIFTFIRYEVMLGQGAPLAAFFAGQDFESFSFLWSDELFAMARGHFSSKWKKFFFLCFSVICCVLAVVVAPATATVLLPIQDWYTMGGSWAWIDTRGQDMFPVNITSNSSVPGDLCRTAGDPRCPSASWESLDHLAAFLPSHSATDLNQKVFVRPPGMWPVATPGALLMISVDVREPFATMPGWSDRRAEESRMMLPHRATGVALVAVMQLWEAAASLFGIENNKQYRGSSSRYSTHETVASIKTRCLPSMPGNSSSPSKVVFPDVRTPERLYTEMEIEQPAVETFIANINASIPELLFFDVDPEGDLAGNVSVGSIVSIPLAEQKTALYGCVTNAQWMLNCEVQVDPDSRITTYKWPIDNDWASVQNTVIHTSFANLSNPYIDIANSTVFQRLAKTAGLVNSTNSRLEWIPCHLETLINGMLINAMARTSPNSQLITTLKDSNGSWWRNFFPRGRVFGRPDGTAFDVSGVDEEQFRSFYFLVEMLGYAYTSNDDTVRYSMIGLFVYCTIAVCFVAWTVGSGITSSSWESTPELLALAMRSPPPATEVMPTSVFEDTKALQKKYCIVAEEGELHLSPMEIVQPEGKKEIPEPNRVKPNVMYR